MWFRKPVPWANILANVAAKHPVLKFSLHLVRYNFILQFDGKIGNALAPVNRFIRHNGVCRAGLHATFATAAIVF